MDVVLAASSAVAYGVADYAGGRASRNLASVVVTVVGQVVSLLMLVVAVLWQGYFDPLRADLFWGAAGGLSGPVGLVCFYHALGHGPVTVVAPVTAMFSLSLPVVVGVLGGERPALLGWVGMVCALVAVALVSGALSERTGGRAARSILVLSVVAGCGFGGFMAALAQTSDDGGMWPLVAARMVSVPTLFAVIAVRRPSAVAARPTWLLALVAGVLDMAANVLYLQAARRGAITTVAVIASLYPVSTVALAFSLDRERVDRTQQVGMVAALLALVLVGTFG
jgi:drug/metabolite transporter (DMT)-like permease